MCDIDTIREQIAEARRRLVSGDPHDRQDALDLLRDVEDVAALGIRLIEEKIDEAEEEDESDTRDARLAQLGAGYEDCDYAAYQVKDALDRINHGDLVGALDSIDDAIRRPKWRSETACSEAHDAALAAVGRGRIERLNPLPLFSPEAA